MSRYALKFPRRVRIHGGEFDESARAIHREDGVKTIQAESGIVLESTIERKQMSTKTTFKRIALVAVAALGFGVMSVASSNAATGVYIWHGNYASNGNCNAAASYACSDFTADSSWVLAGNPATYGFQQTFSATTAADSISSTWSLTSSGSLAGWEVPNLVIAPFNGTVADKTINGVDSTTFTGEFDTTGDWGFVGTDEPYSSPAKLAAAANAATAVVGYVSTTTATAAGGTIGNVATTFTPAVAGTYVFTLTTSGGTTHTWTVNAYQTQAAMDAAKGIDHVINVAKSTSIIVSGEAVTAAADVVVTKSMALSATASATVYVTPLNAAGAAVSAKTLSVTVSGPGTVAIGTNLAAITALTTGTGRAITAAAAGDYVVGVFADGTPGVSTITISSGTTVISTEKVTFFGAATTITPTLVKGILSGTVAAAGAITAIVKDAAGVPVQGQAVSSKSSTDAVIDDAAVACAAVSDADGLVSCTLTGVAVGTTSITLTATNASGAVITSAANSVRVSDGVPTKVVYSFGKASYAPGESANITATVSNAAGVMPAGTYTVTGGVTANYSVGNSLVAGVVTVGDTGAATYTVVMPTGISGTVTLTGTAAATTITATFGSADVVNEALDAALEAIEAAENARLAAEAAIEAGSDAQNAAEAAGEAAVEAGEMAVAAAEAAGAIAQDALDAAIAATDAATDAVAAAEEAKTSADEATAAATAATAAVEALSTKVATLVAGLNAKVTTLSNLLAKIAKKLKVK